MPFQYIRMHGLFHEDMMVYHEENGQPIVNWQYVDLVYDHWLSIGIRPFVELGFMPYDLASGDQTVFWWKGNITPPKIGRAGIGSLSNSSATSLSATGCPKCAAGTSRCGMSQAWMFFGKTPISRLIWNYTNTPRAPLRALTPSSGSVGRPAMALARTWASRRGVRSSWQHVPSVNYRSISSPPTRTPHSTRLTWKDAVT